MKKKFVLLLPLIGGFLLSGCKVELGDQTIYLFGDKPEENEKIEEKANEDNQNTEEKTNNGEDDLTPPDITQHATSISIDPNAPFYLKVDEERQLTASLSPAPEKDDEKYFKWELKGDSIAIPENVSSNKITVKGVKAGTSELKVTNTYNENLYKKFTIKVLEFDEEKDYLWQYSSSDRAKFGYVYKEKPEGDTEGDAYLNGLKWHFTRSEATSLQSSMGSVGFGKGGSPETHIHFECENEREISSLIIESGSANSLAKMTVKVGDTVFMNERKVPKAEYDVIQTLYSDEVIPAKGKITIDVYTPQVDTSKLQDPTYDVPGAFYLKSILIHFNESIPNKTISLVKTSDDIVEGEKYVIIGHSESGYGLLDGSLSSGVKENPHFLEEFSLEDEIEVAGDFDKYGFVSSLDETGKLNFTSDNKIKIGLTEKGSLSVQTNPALLGWDYSVDSNSFLHMSMNDADGVLRHFGANSSTGKFSAYKSVQNNLYLYKI